jgi:hypothetical protein
MAIFSRKSSVIDYIKPVASPRRLIIPREWGGLPAKGKSIAMRASVEFIIDFGSPNAYLAYKALPKLINSHDIEIISPLCLLLAG